MSDYLKSLYIQRQCCQHICCLLYGIFFIQMCLLYFIVSLSLGETDRLCHMKTNPVLTIVYKCVTATFFDKVVKKIKKRYNSISKKPNFEEYSSHTFKSSPMWFKVIITSPTILQSDYVNINTDTHVLHRGWEGSDTLISNDEWLWMVAQRPSIFSQLQNGS